jgi:hypothetical protein
MKTIRNKTVKPLRIALPGGKTLHLGPGKSGQVSDKALERAATRKLLKAGEIEIVGGEGPAQAAGDGSAGAHRSTHGHRQSRVVMPKGDR